MTSTIIIGILFVGILYFAGKKAFSDLKKGKCSGCSGCSSKNSCSKPENSDIPEITQIKF